MPAPLLLPGELATFLVDTARVYGPDAATDRYDVLLQTFACRLTGRSQAVLATGIGPIRTAYYHMLYSPSVTLPVGYWEIEINGLRLTPRANSSGYFRDPAGNVLWQYIDLDQVLVPA